MLTKVMKYDFKSLWKTLIPMYLILGGMTLLTILSSYLTDQVTALSFLTGLMTVAVVIVIFVTLMMTFFRSVQSFYQDFVTKRGYLVNTIPVKKSVLLTSKILTSMVTIIVSSLIICLVTYFLLLRAGLIPVIGEFMQTVANSEGIHIGAFVCYMIVCMLLYYLTQHLMCYFAISLGQLRNTGKLIGSVAAWFLLYIGYEILSVVGVGLTFLLAPNLIVALDTAIPPMWAFWSILGIVVGLVILFGSIATYGTNYILNRKLNLE